jgi:hypothetical protein
MVGMIRLSDFIARLKRPLLNFFVRREEEVCQWAIDHAYAVGIGELKAAFGSKDASLVGASATSFAGRKAALAGRPTKAASQREERRSQRPTGHDRRVQSALLDPARDTYIYTY